LPIDCGERRGFTANCSSSVSILGKPALPSTWRGGGDLPRRDGRRFFAITRNGIAAIDLVVMPTVSFRLLYGLLIMGHAQRQILWLGVTAHPTAEWIANQLTQACGWDRPPSYLIRDRDACYGNVFIRRLRSLGNRDHPISPRSPWQNGYAERLIGSIRRECLDHVVVFGERHLRHVLWCYIAYYNAARTHLSLDKDTPVQRADQSIGRIQVISSDVAPLPAETAPRT
jgi:transposase InsO family protein